MAAGDDAPAVARLRPGDRLVVLGCRCGAATTPGRDDLILLLGADAPLDPIGLRLRCARCGQPQCDARFDRQDDQDDAVPNGLQGNQVGPPAASVRKFTVRA